MTRTQFRNAIIALVAALIVSGGVLALIGQNPIMNAFSSHQDSKPAKDYYLIGTEKSGVQVKQQWGMDDDKHPMQVGAPTIKVVGTPTINNMCQGAIAVNNYAADNPADEAKGLQKYCDDATTADKNGDTFGCSDALTKLAQATNTGYKGSYRIAGAFNSNTVAEACHDGLALDEYKRLGIKNVPIVTDQD